MKLRNAVLVALSLSFFSFPAFAQDRTVDLSVFAAWASPNGRTSFEIADNPNDFDDIEFDSDQGYGAAVNVFWSDRISTEFAASLIDPEINIADAGRSRIVFNEPLEMIPLTAILQYHFLGSGRFDPYIGVGAGYVLFQDINDENELDDVDFDSIDLEDDFAFAANAGLKIGFTDNFGLYLDAKYIPVTAEATAIVPGSPDATQEIDIDPLILAAGISFSF